MKNKELKEWLELGWDKKLARKWIKAGWTRRDKMVNNIIRTDKEVAAMALKWYEQGWDDPVEAYIYKFFKRYDYPVERDKILKNKNGGNKNEV